MSDTARLAKMYEAAHPTQETHCCGFNCECCPFDDGETPLEKRREELTAAALAALPELLAKIDAPIPMYLTCPKCNERHIDEGEFATKRHHTHSCQRCGLTWRPAVVPTVGVAFLPGFKNEPAAFMTFKLAEQEPSTKTLIERGRQALVATAEEPVCEREVGVRDALRALLFHLLPKGASLDLNTVVSTHATGQRSSGPRTASTRHRPR